VFLADGKADLKIERHRNKHEMSQSFYQINGDFYLKLKKGFWTNA
jgi:hypothetical protein